MRNYLDLDSQAYAKPTRRSSKKYTTNINFMPPPEASNTKSSKKITYLLPPDGGEDRYNKENALHTCRSNVNIELPPEKLVAKPKKRSNSFLNKSSATCVSKNSNYFLPEKSKARSRWELTHYPQNHNYETGPSESIPSTEINGDVKAPINFRGGKYLQNYITSNSCNVNL